MLTLLQDQHFQEADGFVHRYGLFQTGAKRWREDFCGAWMFLGLIISAQINLTVSISVGLTLRGLSFAVYVHYPARYSATKKREENPFF